MSELRVRVAGRHIEVGDALRSKITDDLNLGIGRYSSSRDGEAIVTIGKERHLFICEILLHLDSKISLEAKAEANDPHLAFASAQDKLEKRVRRMKRKLTDHHNSEVIKSIAAE